MKHPQRVHRFPPLASLSAARRGGASEGGPSHAEGYQHGVARGYQEGFAQGLEAARAAGLEEGRQDGTAQGLAEGRAQARQHFEGLATPVDALLRGLAAQQEEFEAVLRKEVVDLVAKVARQVIRCELALQPVQMLALVDETLATMPPVSQGIEVYLNPGDLQRIQEIAPERAQAWSLLADPRLESGECRVRAGHREADAGCGQRLAACMEQITQQLSQASAQAATEAEQALPPAEPARAEPAPAATAPVEAAPEPDAPATADPAADTATAAPKKPRARRAAKAPASEAAQ
ncbi:flagellar assembly protein FliH [Paracidovorax anthurii]|uniref:Flagellar assembly protein FliH n=1 Tax=Paracidovorax anthurii TaxID=78229 RepID=A0A328YS49_9BURK|nr:flagellar assembly protein FliH [Paracidovorax anthurii]